ncbi:MAG: hypothetical protein J6O50_07955 [Ruminiclostridium sp.]|nr:hypothetical protein [Ruminiclostridium sp.]
MSMRERAAQFSPFAALTGYDDCISEAGRRTDSKEIPDDDRKAELDRRIAVLSENIYSAPEITVRYFIRDELKDGGRYEVKTGEARRLDPLNRTISFTDGSVISLSDISGIDGEIFKIFD